MSNEKSKPNLNERHTNVQDFIASLGAGTVEKKLGMLLSMVAEGTVLHGAGKKTGKVTIDLTLQQVGVNSQVTVVSKVTHSTPTPHGKKSEDDTTMSVMHVGKGGKLTEEAPREDYDGQFSLVDNGHLRVK